MGRPVAQSSGEALPGPSEAHVACKEENRLEGNSEPQTQEKPVSAEIFSGDQNRQKKKLAISEYLAREVPERKHGSMNCTQPIR